MIAEIAVLIVISITLASVNAKLGRIACALEKANKDRQANEAAIEEIIREGSRGQYHPVSVTRYQNQQIQ